MAIPNGWTTPVCKAILEADKPKRVYLKFWHRAMATTDGPLLCDYCLAPLDTSTPRQTAIDYLVPLQLGGPAINENRVLSCHSCARAKRHRDLVSWKAFTSKGSEQSRQVLLAQRLEVLAIARNHLTHTRARASRASVLRELENRWAHPRFTVYAHHGSSRSFIGWTTRNGGKEAMTLAAVVLRFSCQAVTVSTGRVVLYELPSEHFLDAIWTLIEHHGLIKKLEVPGLDPAPFDPENWQHHWPVHLETVGDLCRRRPRHTGNNSRSTGTAANAKMRFLAHGVLPNKVHLVKQIQALPAPRKPPTPSTESWAIARREQRKANAARARSQAYLEARAALDDFKERVQLGTVEAPSAQELAWMEREVLALL